jgi:two-component sensor histidine kinase
MHLIPLNYRAQKSRQHNGIGLPPDFDPSEFESLGMSLMRGLTDQLGGIFEMEGRGGLTISVSFRVNRGLAGADQIYSPAWQS